MVLERSHKHVVRACQLWRPFPALHVVEGVEVMRAVDHQDVVLRVNGSNGYLV